MCISNILEGHTPTAKALLDGGCSHTTAGRAYVEKAGLIIEPCEIEISIAMADGSTQSAVGQTVIKLRNRLSNKCVANVTALVLSDLSLEIKRPDVNICRLFGVDQEDLADDWTGSKIDVILGQDVLWKLWVNVFYSPLHGNAPIVLQASKLGFVAQGLLDEEQEYADGLDEAHLLALKELDAQIDTDDKEVAGLDEDKLAAALQRYMSLEGLGISSTPKNEMRPIDVYAYEHFAKNTVYNEVLGEYTVALMFKPDHPPLANNEGMAMAQMRSQERRFERNPELRTQYIQGMKRYFDAGDVEELPPGEQGIYFLPHSAVIKLESTTTKVRIVFNGSAKTASGASLNDCLLIGPNIIKDSLELLLRFRWNWTAIVGDISRMYPCVNLREEDRNYLCFKWRESSEHPMRTFRHKKLGMGIADSAFQSDQCIRLHCESYEKAYPAAVRVMREDRYVDDVTTGTDSPAEATNLIRTLSSMMREGNFHLRKWMSNSPEVMAGIPAIDRADLEQVINFCSQEDSGQIMKTLGVQWNPKMDALYFKCAIKHVEVITKRVITSVIAQLYDPFGLAQPFVVTAKRISQELWIEDPMPANMTKVERRKYWDSKVSEDLRERWLEWFKQIPILAGFQIPRCPRMFDDISSYEWHVFGDASPRAYAAVIYLVVIRKDGTRHSNFYSARARVAPKKGETLARLELVASLCGARLLEHLKNAVTMKLACPCYLWSDSAVTLRWLRKPPETWKEFIYNRVKEIHQLTLGYTYKFCPGLENPADLATRGISAEELVSSKEWLHGPPWLVEPSSSWPDDPFVSEEEEALVQKEARAKGAKPRTAMPPYHPENVVASAQMAAIKVSPENKTRAQDDPLVYLMNKFSSWNTLVRVTAYVLRVFRKKQAGRGSVLTGEELQHAEEFWVRKLQIASFPATLHALKSGKPLQKGNRLKDLLPFIDHEGLLRVGGRLQNSEMPYETKHPLLLPHRHALTHVLIDTIHREQLHAGPEWTLFHLRQHFWVVQGRRTCKAVCSKCNICRMNRANLSKQGMAPLPDFRVTPADPFERTGVDFAGPFLVYLTPDRDRRKEDEPVKVWISLFTCLVTRAVHLEVVMGLSTDEFLMAFSRFSSRRGMPTLMVSDNGTTFVKAKKELGCLWSSQSKSKIKEALSQKGVEWRFNAPSAPWQGGVFERMVRTVKEPLKKVLQGQTLYKTKFETLLVEVEAIVNSRPLATVSGDNDDPLPITPSQLISGHVLRQLPHVKVPPRLAPKKETPTLRWRVRLHNRKRFFELYRKDYLLTLQTTQKWHEACRDLREGDVVHVADDDKKSKATWPLARVTQVLRGRDGKVRNVVLQTSSGIIRRPVQRLVKLEVGPRAPIPFDADADDGILAEAAGGAPSDE